MARRGSAAARRSSSGVVAACEAGALRRVAAPAAPGPARPGPARLAHLQRPHAQRRQDGVHCRDARLGGGKGGAGSVGKGRAGWRPGPCRWPRGRARRAAPALRPAPAPAAPCRRGWRTPPGWVVPLPTQATTSRHPARAHLRLQRLAEEGGEDLQAGRHGVVDRGHAAGGQRLHAALDGGQVPDHHEGEDEGDAHLRGQRQGVISELNPSTAGGGGAAHGHGVCGGKQRQAVMARMWVATAGAAQCDWMQACGGVQRRGGAAPSESPSDSMRGAAPAGRPARAQRRALDGPRRAARGGGRRRVRGPGATPATPAAANRLRLQYFCLHREPGRSRGDGPPTPARQTHTPPSKRPSPSEAAPARARSAPPSCIDSLVVRGSSFVPKPAP